MVPRRGRRGSILCANMDHYRNRDAEEIRYICKLATGRGISSAMALMQLYEDYMGSREAAIAYNDLYIRDDPEAEHPYFEYPLYPRVGMLRDLHDKAARDAVSYSGKKGEEDNALLDKEIAGINKSPLYKRFLYRGKGYSVIAATSVADLEYEGKMLKHCIGTYGHKFASGSSYIYFIRKDSEPDTPFYSAEVVGYPHFFGLTQLYTYKDGTDKTPEFADFVREWCRVKDLRPLCAI